MKFFNVELVCAPNSRGVNNPFISMKLEGVPARDSREAKMKVLGMLQVQPSTTVKFTNVVEL